MGICPRTRDGVVGQPPPGMTLRHARSTMTGRCVRWRSSSTSSDTFGKFSSVSRTQPVKKPESTLSVNCTCGSLLIFIVYPIWCCASYEFSCHNRDAAATSSGFSVGWPTLVVLYLVCFACKWHISFFYCLSIVKERC